ncbi:MAG: UvrD-helicase domain-containing protein, partial [Lachnospiraceae bacterium]|nr:UvrD-helicase domain-containing protein [Lachnospiraceae bacterium]
MGYPWPEEWLKNCVKFYEYADENAFMESMFLELVNEYADGVLNEILNKYNLMLEICGEGGLEVYTETFENEQEAIRLILKETNYDRRRSLLNVKFNRLPRCGKDGYDEEIKKIVTDSRSEVKDTIKKLRERMYYQSVKEAMKEVEKCHDIIQCYVELTKSFLEKFRQKKHEKNIIDFDDFEHYAIEILISKEDGTVKPTKTADELAQDYKEVMVDEYQDSNLVQETILNSISGERFGIHNRFMVGDVKQSIYGFRGANPDIFIEKYNQYSTDHTAIDYKIILDRNFRSRKGII